jgi:hypothetical protein
MRSWRRRMADCLGFSDSAVATQGQLNITIIDRCQATDALSPPACHFPE